MTRRLYGAGQRSIALDSAEALGLRVLLYGARFVVSVLVSRGLGPTGRGVYSLHLVAAEAMVSFCKLGLEHANVFLRGTRDIAWDRLSAQNGLVALVTGAAGVAGLLLAPLALPGLFAESSPLLLVLAGLTIPFALHTQLSAGILTLEGQVAWPFRAALISGTVQAGLLAALFAAGAVRIAPTLGVNLATAILGWILCIGVPAGGRRRWIGWDARLMRETLRQSLPLHLGMVLFFLHLRLDMFWVQGMLGAEALGQYSLAVALAETALLATDSLALAILHRQMGNTVEEAAAMGLRGARVNVLLGGGLAVLWILGGPLVIRICFGQAFTPAYLPLAGLMPGIVFLGMQRVCGGAAIRTGRPARIAAIYGVSLLCNVALNVWWIPRWGLMGAALASSVSYGVGAAGFLSWAARLAGSPLAAAVLPTRADVAALVHAARTGMVAFRKILPTAHP